MLIGMITSKAMKRRDPTINKIKDFINSRMTVVWLVNQKGGGENKYAQAYLFSPPPF